jgi:lipopolysaccharide/colanic/teichoic acid biosynthesis glycosyltransferase
MAKRALDVLGAGLGLLLLAPLFLLVALAIKLDTPGPVFFRQDRVGLHGRRFRIFKFRTMEHRAAAEGTQLTVAGDARITRVGRFLRATKLDELAQLIDVVRGTMSLVGPRPEVPRYVEHYPPEWRERLLSVRPGMTDVASLRYRHENDLLARADDPEREYIEVILPLKLQVALDYVDRPTLANDLRVLGLTLRAAFAPALPHRRSSFMNDTRLWSRIDRAMSSLHPQRRWAAMAVDALVILACWQVTYLFRLGFERWQPGRPAYDDYVAVGVCITYLVCMALAGVPRSLWRFFGFDDFRRLTVACFAAGLLSAVAVLMAHLVGVARAVLLLHPLFTLVALSLVRMTWRLVWEHARSRSTDGGGELRRAVVLGAGDAARRLVAGLHLRDGWTVLALLDDDPAKQGLRLGGVPVIGGLERLREPDLVLSATHVIVAMPGATAEARAAALAQAKATGLTVFTVPSQSELQAEERPVSAARQA